jgi:uncharacterized delta-60 repeat protein
MRKKSVLDVLLTILAGFALLVMNFMTAQAALPTGRGCSDELKTMSISSNVAPVTTHMAVCSISSTQWVRTYTGYGGNTYEVGDFIQPTADGGFLIVQNTDSFGAGNGDVWVLKLNGDGTIVWQKTYGGSGIDKAYSIQVTADGGYVMAGYSDSFNGPPSQGDAWVVKLNADGTIAWQKTYGDGGDTVDVGKVIQQTSDGGFILAGRTASFGAGNDDFWILKLNGSGAISWENTYGGSAFDEPNAIQETADGGFIVTGRTYSYGEGLFDTWVLKLNADGTVDWEKTYGESSNDVAYDIQETADGGFIVVGYTDSFGAGAGDILLLKLNGDGTVAWQKTYGGTALDYAVSIEETTDTGFVMAGRTQSFGAGDNDLWVLKLNNSGTIVWQRAFGGAASDVGLSVEQVGGGFVVVGATESFGESGPNLWVSRLNSNGEIPACAAMDNSNAVVSNASAITQDTSGIVEASSAISTTTNVLPQDAASETSVICEFAAPPDLAINYTSGKPGSLLTLTGSDFPPNSQAMIVVNGSTLTSTLAVDGFGGFVFLLDTSQADVGRYFVTATANPSATADFVLDLNAPLRPQEGSGPILNVPSGIAFTRLVYLPLVQR